MEEMSLEIPAIDLGGSGFNDTSNTSWEKRNVEEKIGQRLLKTGRWSGRALLDVISAY